MSNSKLKLVKVIEPDHPRAKFMEVYVDGELTKYVTKVDEANKSVTMYGQNFRQNDVVDVQSVTIEHKPKSCKVVDIETQEVYVQW